MTQKRDGGRGIVLNITEEIINVSTQRDSSHCVIAEALRRAMPDAKFVAVDLQTIRYSDPVTRRRYIYLTPALAQRVLVDFDRGNEIHPFQMRLGHPAQIVKIVERKRDGKAGVRHDPDLPAGKKKRLAAPTATSPGKVPTVLGGTYPPTAALSSTRGRRRAYGLRSLKA